MYISRTCFTHILRVFAGVLHSHYARLQVDYFNNKVIVDLVEAPHTGVLAILDEACLNVGKVTDKVRPI